MARTLRDAECAALRETRREALHLLATAGLDGLESNFGSDEEAGGEEEEDGESWEADVQDIAQADEAAGDEGALEEGVLDVLQCQKRGRRN